jgi:hypothetical protein
MLWKRVVFLKMPTLNQENNLVIIKYEGGVVVLQKELIVGFHVKPDPDTLDIILTQNTVSIKISEADGWDVVIKGLKELITQIRRV